MRINGKGNLTTKVTKINPLCVETIPFEEVKEIEEKEDEETHLPRNYRIDKIRYDNFIKEQQKSERLQV